MAESIDLILYGHPPVGEIAERAMFDLEQIGRSFRGDVDVVVRLTVHNRRCLTPVTTCLPAIAEVIRAAARCGTIDSTLSVRSIYFGRPVVDGLDVTYVSFRPSIDRAALI